MLVMCFLCRVRQRDFKFTQLHALCVSMCMPTCTRYVRVMYAERAAARALHSQGSGRLSFTQRECAHSASFTQREFHAARVSRGASSRSAGTVARERVARFARPHHNSTVTATAAPRKRAPTPRCWHRGGTEAAPGHVVDGLLSMEPARVRPRRRALGAIPSGALGALGLGLTT